MLARRPLDPGDLIPYEEMRRSSEQRVVRDKAAHLLVQQGDLCRSRHLHDADVGQQSRA